MGKPELGEVKTALSDKIKPAIDTRALVDAMDSPKKADKLTKEANQLAKDLYKGKEVDGLSEATPRGESPKERIEAARDSIDDILTPKLDKKIRRAAAEAITKKSDTESAQKKAIIQTAPIEKVYALLMQQKDGVARFAEITEQEAKKIKPYKRWDKDPAIDASQMLRNDLADHFDNLRLANEAIETNITNKVKGHLEKRYKNTKELIRARKGANELRLGDEPGTASITIDKTGDSYGMVHAAKNFEELVGKKDAVLSERTFWDSDRGTYLREVVYGVEDASGATQNNEAVVELWNVGQNGGNLVSSTLVKVGTETKRSWKFRGPKNGRWSPVPRRHVSEEPATVFAERGRFRNRDGNSLSKAARRQLEKPTNESVTASTRESSGSSDMAGYATTSRLGALNAQEMGKPAGVASRIARSPGFFEKMAARMFSNSKRMSKKAR